MSYNAQGEQAKLYLIILHNIRNKLYLHNKNQLNFAMNRKNLMLPESYTTKKNIGKLSPLTKKVKGDRYK